MSRAAPLKTELTQVLKDLRLPTMRACYAEAADQARQEDLPYEGYLLEVARRESETRRQHRIQRYLRQSKLPLEKNWQTLERARWPKKLQAQLTTLLDGSFLDRCENVLAFGNPGAGKTHVLCALGQELIHQDRQILFMPCNLLVQELLLAKRELTLPRLLKRWSKYDGLILDDIGYVQHSREEMEVLFALLAHRYERGSVLITSNLPFSQWETIFKDPMTTAAAIDRLVHHCVILEMNLPSYRLEQSKKKKKATTTTNTTPKKST
ncbi:MAG: AAA family ATPase [Acidiferrobacteraceae bacterium]|nr:AAA family ATPase [Acidiferrobacteraceae bacterium]|tara:strand:- start:252 stop:1049 length:798 start_codon:yes stop_codon:yes gene_type:complete